MQSPSRSALIFYDVRSIGKYVESSQSMETFKADCQCSQSFNHYTTKLMDSSKSLIAQFEICPTSPTDLLVPGTVDHRLITYLESKYPNRTIFVIGPLFEFHTHLEDIKPVDEIARQRFGCFDSGDMFIEEDDLANKPTCVPSNSETDHAMEIEDLQRPETKEISSAQKKEIDEGKAVMKTKMILESPVKRTNLSDSVKKSKETVIDSSKLFMKVLPDISYKPKAEQPQLSHSTKKADDRTFSAKNMHSKFRLKDFLCETHHVPNYTQKAQPTHTDSSKQTKANQLGKKRDSLGENTCNYLPSEHFNA